MDGAAAHRVCDRTDLPPATVVYQRGDPDWCRRPDPDSSAAPPAAAEAATADLVIRLAPGDPSDRRGLVATSPSRLEGGRRVRLADYLGVASAAGMQYGTLIHCWMEQVEWLDHGPPAAERLLQAASRVDTSGLDVDACLADFRAALARPNISRLLSRSVYVPVPDMPLDRGVWAELAGTPPRLEVHRERRIAVRDELTILTGNVDRLVLLFHGERLVAADIIDFKTDRLDAAQREALDERVAYYRPQLTAYRRAVCKMLRLDESHVAARLLFLGLDQVVSV